MRTLRIVLVMDRSLVLTELPDVEATALRLHDGGFPDVVIAIALGIPVTDVAEVLARGEAEVTRRLRAPAGGRDPFQEGVAHG